MQPNELAARRIKYKDLLLQPLRIPAGWRVVFNNFFEVRPTEFVSIEGLPRENKWILFDEDMIYIKHEVFDLGIDLGWYPSCDPNGGFVVQVIRGENWEEPVGRFESTEFDAVVEQMEKWLDAGSSGVFSEGPGPTQKGSNKIRGQEERKSRGQR